MKIQDFENHLNELLHDLSSPLNSMRLQLGLLRDALKTDDRLAKRVESAERQVVRSQTIIDAFVTAVSLRVGQTNVVPIVRRIFGRFGIEVECEVDEALLGVEEESLERLFRCFAEGCARRMAKGSSSASVGCAENALVITVQGRFETGTVARALRLSYTDSDGNPDLALARTRLSASAAGGALVLEHDALVLRLPLESECTTS